MITGFPGETETGCPSSLDFVSSDSVERLGVFALFQEEKTAA